MDIWKIKIVIDYIETGEYKKFIEDEPLMVI